MIQELIQELAALLSPQAAELLLMADEETQAILLEVAEIEGVPAVEAALMELAAELVGANANAVVPGGGLPPGATADPAIAPVMPPPAAMLPPEAMGLPGGPPPGAAPPGPAGGPDPLAQAPGGTVRPDLDYPTNVKKLKLPEKPKAWKPKPLPNTRFSNKRPSLDRVLEDARLGRDQWSARDRRIAEDTSMYHLHYDLEIEEDVDMLDGQIIHRRADPAILIDRVTGLTTASTDRVSIHVPARYDDDDYRESAQKFEDFTRTMRMLDAEAWFERGGTHGDPQPPLERKEAGLMALEGGFGWLWRVEPEDEEHPFVAEPVPLSELYPLGHATTRQFVMPLHRARAEFKEIDRAYKQDDERKVSYEGLEIRVICWSDNYGLWHAVAWDEEGTQSHGTTTRVYEGQRWIQRPTRVNYGFPYYNYVIWNGTYAGPNQYTKATHNRFVGYGVLTMLRKTYRLMDIMVSAVATGAIRFQNPALFRTVAEGRDMNKVPELDLSPGAENFGRPDEKVQPLVFDVASTQSGASFVNSLAAELNSAIPSVVTGGPGGSQSGFQYMQQNEQAQALWIGPIIDAMQQAYQLQNKQRGILAYRYAKMPKDYKDMEYFSEYQVQGYSSKKGGSYYTTLKTKDLERSGVATRVRYNKLSLNEEIALAGLVQGLVQSHLMSHEQALIRLGVEDPARELRNIFQYTALMSEDMLKAVSEASVMQGGNALLQHAWNRVFLQNTMGGGGSGGPQKGVPSQPNVTGGATARMPAEYSNPNQNMQTSNGGY